MVDRELLRHMLEIRTQPSTDLADLGRQIVATRKTLGTAAGETGAALVASGTSPSPMATSRWPPRPATAT